MEEHEKHVRVTTAGHPRESDKKFFDLMRFIVQMDSSYRTAVIMCSTLKTVRCDGCGEARPRLITFTLNKN